MNYTCEMCNKTITYEEAIENEFTVKWNENCFRRTVFVVLCRQCANYFRHKILNCK